MQRHTEPTARALLATPAAQSFLSSVDQHVTGWAQRFANAAFDRLDVTALVRDHVDLDAVVATVDVDAILARIDLLGLATFIIEGIDLPVIIRESTGGVTTEVLRGARQHSYEADQTVARVIDRMLMRHRVRETRSVNGALPAAESPA